MRADRAVDQQLQQVGAQHVPVVVMVLLAFVAAHDQAANSLVRQQCLVNREIGQIGLDRGPLLRVQRLPGLQGVERSRGVARVVGERIGRQTRREVVAHDSTLRSRHSYRASRPPGMAQPGVWRGTGDVNADKMGESSSSAPGGPTHVDRRKQPSPRRSGAYRWR